MRHQGNRTNLFESDDNDDGRDLPPVDWFEPTCRVVQLCLSDDEAFVALSPAQIRQMAEHMASCSVCATEFNAYEQVDLFIESLACDPPRILEEEHIEQWKQAQRDDAPSVACAADDADDSNDMGGDRRELAGVAGTARAHTSTSEEAQASLPRWAQPTTIAALTKSKDDTVAPPLLTAGKRNRFPTSCSLFVSWGATTRPSEQDPEDILQQIIQLLHLALNSDGPTVGRSITFTWLLDTQLLDDTHSRWKDWSRAVRLALDQGWTIRHLIRTSHTFTKFSRVTEYMRGFLGARGKYEPSILPLTSQWTAPVIGSQSPGTLSEFVLIPDIGGIQLLASNGGKVTSCRMIPPGDDLALTERSLDRGIAHAHPVFDGIYPSPTIDYLKAILDIEQRQSRRRVVVNGLSESLVPAWIHEARASALIAAGAQRDEVEAALRLEVERAHAMRHNLDDFEHIDVCPLSAIDRLLATGCYQTADDWTQWQAPPLTLAQRRGLMDSLIDLLESPQKRYEFWLLPDPDSEQTITEFIVKEGYKAITEFWLTDELDQRTRADLAISEPSSVASLLSPQYWDDLAAHAIRDPHVVADILRKRRDSYSQEHW